MADANVYVFNGDNCKFEGMTKEQIYTAIQEAITTGEIGDIDVGFVSSIKEQNTGVPLKFWVGTTAQFNAITTKDDNTFYILSDDTEKDDIDGALAKLQQKTNVLVENSPIVIAGTAEDDGVFFNKNDFVKSALFYHTFSVDNIGVLLRPMQIDGQWYLTGSEQYYVPPENEIKRVIITIPFSTTDNYIALGYNGKYSLTTLDADTLSVKSNTSNMLVIYQLVRIATFPDGEELNL